MLRAGSLINWTPPSKEKTEYDQLSSANARVTFEDIKKLSAREINEELIKHGVNIKNLRLEEKRIKLGQVLKISTIGNKNVQEIISKAKCGWTKDIRQIPLVTIERVKEYLINSERKGSVVDSSEGVCEQFSDALLVRYKTSRSYDLWASGNLHSFEVNTLSENEEVCLIRCKSNASWTTGKVYETTVMVDKATAKPVGAYCLCVAGAGEACSHTAALLFGIAEFISRGFQQLPDGPATTEQLAYWVNPRGSKVQPKPLKNIVIEKKNFNKAPRKKRIRTFEHDPRHHNDTEVDFQDYLQLMSSLRQCKPNAPIVCTNPQSFVPSKTHFITKSILYKSYLILTSYLKSLIQWSPQMKKQ